MKLFKILVWFDSPRVKCYVKPSANTFYTGFPTSCRTTQGLGPYEIWKLWGKLKISGGRA